MTKIKLSSIMFILCFMTVSSGNVFIYFLSLAIPRMGTLWLYIQSFTFDQDIEKQREYFHSHIFCSFFYFIIWYDPSLLKMAFIVRSRTDVDPGDAENDVG